MIELRPLACRRHRDALLDFIDRREIGSRTRVALAHLDRCPACERELAATALAITALRRLAREAEPAEPAADAWARLRARIERPRAALWRWRATLAGIGLSAGLVATLVAPSTMWHSRPTLARDADGPFAAVDPAGQIEWSRAVARPPLPAEQITILVPRTAPPSGTRFGGPDGRGHQFTTVTVEPPPGRVK